MVCQSPAFVGTHSFNRSIRTWNGDVTFTAEEFWEPAHDSPSGPPTGLSHLVYAVARATAANKRLMTVGSAWSFENLIQTDAWLISLKQLDRRLHYVTSAGGQGLADEWRQRQGEAAGMRRLVHVEAGIQLGVLSELLHANEGEPWALAALGGTNGQSLAGAISTSTHGADWQQPPFPDLVRAMHLVTEGGRQVWIERASEPVTEDARLRPVLPCADTQIIRCDDVFNAALVSFGRFGVIYSVIVEVTQAFRVVEVVTVAHKGPALQALADGATAARPLDPLFTLLAAEPLLPSLQVRKEAVGDPYSCQLVFNSQDTTTCWVQRRWVTTAKEPPLHLPTDPGVFSALGVRAVLKLLKLAWAIGAEVGGIAGGAVSMALNNAMTDGRRGPHHLITSGTSASSQDIGFVVDAIEIIFGAGDANFVPFLRAILNAARGYKQAGSISVRLSLSSRATLSMHNVKDSHAYSVEVSTLTPVPDSKAWMNFVHDQALVYGGRPHWGQYNKLNASWVNRLYGDKVQKWHRALWSLTRDSDRFSSAFTRQRGLDPSTLRLVTGTLRAPDGTLTHLAGRPGADWSPVSVGDVIAGIRSGAESYAVESAGDLSFINVVNNSAVGGPLVLDFPDPNRVANDR